MSDDEAEIFCNVPVPTSLLDEGGPFFRLEMHIVKDQVRAMWINGRNVTEDRVAL